MPMAPKTRGHIRSLMYRLFEKAMLWELIPLERNPMGFGELKGGSKRLKPTRFLTEEEFGDLLSQLDHPYRKYGSFGGMHGPLDQRGDGFALESDRLRNPGHASQGRVRSQPSHEAEIRVFPGRIAAGSRRVNHSVRVEATLPRDARRLGFPQPRDGQTLRFWLAPEESVQPRVAFRFAEPGRAGLAEHATHGVTATPGVAGNGFD